MGWTDERVELLAKLWSEGLSASQIAGQLGGVTRNAVIGKVHRLKLEGRAKSPAAAAEAGKSAVEESEEETVVEMEIAPRIVAAQVQSAQLRSIGRSMGGGMQGATALKMEPEIDLVADVMPERVVTTGEVVPISRNLTLVQLSDRTCKWPLGDPLSADFRFCGNHSNDASPYCLYHARIAFQPASERRRIR
ncbi:MAG: GcrA cell cycle regulator [Rhizobiaceae bacterium]|nr:GcrA cell cycle regulator [Rhizobiaceae bacterium]